MSASLTSRNRVPTKRDPLGPQTRKTVLSAFRLKVVLGTFITLLLLGLAGLELWLIDGVFDHIAPGLREDLQHGTQRILREAAQTTEVGLAFGEPAMLERVLAAYRHDDDVVALVVADGQGRVVYTQGQSPVPADALFTGEPGVVRSVGEHLAAWSPSGASGVGRVAVVVSTARMHVADELRAVQNRVLVVTLIACALALIVSLAFVGLYLGPLIRMTEHAFHELELMADRALESARLKSQFLAVMSHEIRTPMNAIVGMSELLVDAGLRPTQRRQAEVVHASAVALLDVINDILDFSKLEAGKLTLRSEPFELRELVEEVAVLAATRAQGRNLEVLAELASDLPGRIVGDAARLRQILVNLATNAVKFTERGHVLLRATTAGERIRFAVADTGMGISEADQKLLFKAFTQVDGSLTRAHGGTGLGLAISQRLIEQMGGRIELDSAPGRGSTFAFELKLAAERPTRPRPPAELSGLRALVVDDYPQARTLLSDRLHHLGLDVDAAAGPDDALALLRSAARRAQPYHVAFIDLHLAGASGLDVATTIRADPDLAATKLFLLCPITGDVDENEARVRVDATLTKPLRARSLQAALLKIEAGQDAWGASGVYRIPSGLEEAPQPAVVEVPALQPAPGDVRILLVDDNPVNQEVAMAALGKLGAPCHVVDSGEGAVLAVRERSYDLIFMDCQMPGMDGYAATAQIRRVEGSSRHTPIVAMTAHTQHERMATAGMDDYLPKPFRVEELRHMLEKWLPRKGTGETSGVSVVAQPAPATPEPKPVAPVPVDDSMLAALDPEAYRPAPIIRVFLSHAPEHLTAVRTAANKADAKELASTAHRLKGSLLAMGALGLAGLCKDIERAAGSGELDRAAAALQRLEHIFDNVCSALEREADAAPPEATG